MESTNLSDEICESYKKLAEQMKGLDPELAVNEIFVSVPGLESNFILGPCFKANFLSELSPFYPLAEGERLFHSSLEPDRYIGKTMKSWPTVNRTWTDWVERVEKSKGKVWKSAGIYDAIQLSKIEIRVDKNLLYAALFFWSVSTNSFHFRFGMMSPTVLDIVALTGLRPHGEEAITAMNTLESSEDFAAMSRNCDDRLSYCKFLDRSMGAVAVTEEEHVSFLVMWLSKYLFCNVTPNMKKECTKLAFALSGGRKLALAPLLLSSVYGVCRDIIMNKFDGGGGPLWILQFWIQSYFPEYRPLVSDTGNAPTYGYPLAKSVLRPQTFNQCFTFFLTCSSRTPPQFTPFSSRTCGPEWFNKSLDPNARSLPWKELNEIWASYLLPRDLLEGSNTRYCPNQFARQFGMTQAVPLPFYQNFDELKRKFSLVSFKVDPKSTCFFDSWWSAYIRSTNTSSRIVNKTPPAIVNLSSQAMRARHEQSAAEHASKKKMKCEGNSNGSQTEILNTRKISHNKADKPAAKKRKAKTFKKISTLSSTPREPPLGANAVKSVPGAVAQEEMDRGMPVLDDDAPSIASSFTSEDEEEPAAPYQPLAEAGGGLSEETIKLENVDDFFARVEAQIRKAQSLSFAASHSPSADDQRSSPTSPPSAAALVRAKADIARLLSIPFQDVLAVENYSVLCAALNTVSSMDDTVKKLRTNLPDLCSTFRRGKKDQEEFYTRAAKKVLLIDELKRGQELYINLKDSHDKLNTAMDSIKNQIRELKTSWKEAMMKKKAVQVQKLSLAKDCFTKCSALDEMETELPAVEQKKEMADSDIARVEASWADFKHKLMKWLP